MSPSAKILIEKILSQAYDRQGPALTRLQSREMLENLFELHEVTCVEVQTWNQDDFNKIILHENKPAVSARKRTPKNRHSDALEQQEKKVTPYTDASESQINDALKRLGYE